MMAVGESLVWLWPRGPGSPWPARVPVVVAHAERRARRVGVRVPADAMARFRYPGPLVLWVDPTELRRPVAPEARP